MSDRFETKGNIRASVLKRVGYGSQGAAAGPIINVIDEFIDDAYSTLFDVYGVRGRIQDFYLYTTRDQRWYDIPSGLDYDQLVTPGGVAVLYQETWIPMFEGITLDHRTIYDTYHYPQRYDIEFNPTTGKTQIKLWPEVDDVYSVKLRGVIDKASLEKDADIAYVDESMMKKYVTAYVKAHLGRKDADAAMASLNRRLKEVKGNQHGQNRYIRGRRVEIPEPKPVVV